MLYVVYFTILSFDPSLPFRKIFLVLWTLDVREWLSRSLLCCKNSLSICIVEVVKLQKLIDSIFTSVAWSGAMSVNDSSVSCVSECWVAFVIHPSSLNITIQWNALFADCQSDAGRWLKQVYGRNYRYLAIYFIIVTVTTLSYLSQCHLFSFFIIIIIIIII